MRDKVKKKSRMKKFGFFLIVLSLMMLSYPIVRNQVNRYFLRYEIFKQEQQLPSQKQQDQQVKKAKKLNQQLADQPVAIQDFLQANTYQTEKIYGTRYGTLISMGSVWIPSIKVMLPIYEGTNDTVLSYGAGHVRYSSFPIGGKSTHTVIAAHSGLVSGDYFLKLPKVKKKQYFFIKNQQEVLAYQVFKIREVQPNNSQAVKIIPNQDLATLLTCVPIGINSKRLLVTGKRVPLAQAKTIFEENDKENKILRQLSQSTITITRRQVMVLFTLVWMILGGMIYLVGKKVMKW